MSDDIKDYCYIDETFEEDLEVVSEEGINTYVYIKICIYI